ncbi:ribonuclease H [Trifolium pratense]|uniref:Ribonuclease H n=1 Tax=Trifolium pratense TaxID=57577 RepID=A0A2K3JN76_TRIPR|nr:ribonuclease H [Trifolium pratense]
MEWNSLKNDQAGSTIMNNDPIWKHLWKLKIHPKHTNLIWRILNQALPVRDRLNTRGIRCDPICPRCNKALETTDHVFKQCDWAQAIWFGSPMSINFQSMEPTISFMDWISNVILNEETECVANIIAITYSIWRARNLLVFQEKDLPVMNVVQQAMLNANEYRTLSIVPHLSSSTSATKSRGNDNYWTPPTNGTLKLNVDAHPCDDGRWGLGLVLRTEAGECVGAATKVVRGATTIVEGEAHGLNAALDFIASLPVNPITIEMDSLSIVESVKKRRYTRNYWGRIARRCGEYLDKNPRSGICWVRRTGNIAAHSLANWAILEPNKTWCNETPMCIRDIVQKDKPPCNFES